MRTWLMLAVLVGCKGGDDDGVADTGETGGEDTGLEDSGETAVACETLAVPGTVAVAAGAQVPSGEVTAELVFAEIGEELLEGEVLASTTLDALTAGQHHGFELCAPNVPPSSDLYVPDTAYPDLSVASYAVRLQAADDSWVGASLPDFLFWVEGTIPTELSDQGLVAGWNHVRIDFADGGLTAAAFGDASALDAPAQLLFVEPATLGAELVPDLSAQSDLVVGGWNINRFVDNTLPAPPNPTIGSILVANASAGADLSLGTLGPAPADHTEVFDGFEFAEAAFYMVGVWSDDNSNLAFDTGEVMHANSTQAVPARTLLYVEPTDWRAAVLPSFGMAMGWNVVEGETPVPWSGGVVLDAS